MLSHAVRHEDPAHLQIAAGSQPYAPVASLLQQAAGSQERQPGSAAALPPSAATLPAETESGVQWIYKHNHLLLSVHELPFHQLLVCLSRMHDITCVNMLQCIS